MGELAAAGHMIGMGCMRACRQELDRDEIVVSKEA
jgi:hypothetical protein